MKAIRGIGHATMMVALAVWAAGCQKNETLGVVELRSTVEDRMPDGSLYTPATQSFLRGHHWLESAERLAFEAGSDLRGRIELQSPEDDYYLEVDRLPLDQLVPRLHYRPAEPPDGFDAYNLMMAEYSRNGMSVPTGVEGDSIPHFESNLSYGIPWSLDGDYRFVPDPHARPYRVSVINNCLRPGLWEVSAQDRAGEIYHAWYSLDDEPYHRLVARVNGLDEQFVAAALEFSDATPRLELERLRREVRAIGELEVELAVDGQMLGFSTQDSRQKLQNGFVQVRQNGHVAAPSELADLTRYPVRLTRFVEPGKYSFKEREEFDLTFLARPESAELREVEPRTHYDWRDPRAAPPDHAGAPHLELRVAFGDRRLLVGNLPLPLLARQEDYVLHGFGVGILAAGDLAEKRRFLIEQGPAPSYAYLAEERDGELYALNSHALGIEQIFVRTRPDGERPHWEITISSYERIVDLVKYRLPIPAELVEPLRQISASYVSPLYFTYRDDNLR